MVNVPRPPRWWTISVAGIVLAGAATVGTVRAIRTSEVIYTVPGPVVTVSPRAHASQAPLSTVPPPHHQHGPLPPHLRLYEPRKNPVTIYASPSRVYVPPVYTPPVYAPPVRKPVPVYTPHPVPARTRHVRPHRPAPRPVPRPAVTVTVTPPPQPQDTYTPPPDTYPAPAETTPGETSPPDTYSPAQDTPDGGGSYAYASGDGGGSGDPSAQPGG